MSHCKYLILLFRKPKNYKIQPIQNLLRHLLKLVLVRDPRNPKNIGPKSFRLNNLEVIIIIPEDSLI
jgi:hypothetical protein